MLDPSIIIALIAAVVAIVSAVVAVIGQWYHTRKTGESAFRSDLMESNKQLLLETLGLRSEVAARVAKMELTIQALKKQIREMEESFTERTEEFQETIQTLRTYISELEETVAALRARILKYDIP